MSIFVFQNPSIVHSYDGQDGVTSRFPFSEVLAAQSVGSTVSREPSFASHFRDHLS